MSRVPLAGLCGGPVVDNGERRGTSVQPHSRATLHRPRCPHDLRNAGDEGTKTVPELAESASSVDGDFSMVVVKARLLNRPPPRSALVGNANLGPDLGPVELWVPLTCPTVTSPRTGNIQRCIIQQSSPKFLAFGLCTNTHHSPTCSASPPSVSPPARRARLCAPCALSPGTMDLSPV